MSLHQHEVAMYARCPRKFDYYVTRNWEKVAVDEKVSLGKWFHNHIAEAARRATYTYDEEDTGAAEGYELAQRYQKYFPLPPLEEIVSVEAPYEQGGVVFRPDLVYRYSAAIIIRDYKTMKKLPELGDRGADEMDFQALMYLWGLSGHFKEPLIFEHEFIRTAVPQDPDLTLEGKVSRSKIITSKERYINAMISNNQALEIGDKAYAAYIEALPTEAEFFRRKPIYKTPQEIMNFHRDEVLPLLTMFGVGYSKHRTVIKNGSDACEQCFFYGPCVRELYSGRLSDTEMEFLGYQRRAHDAV